MTGLLPAGTAWPGHPMDAAACLALLSASHVGRLAFTDRALPAVVPLPYTVHDGHVLVAAHRDSPIAAAVRRSVVAFQVDSGPAGGLTEWSVTVVGPARVAAVPAATAGPTPDDRLAPADRCLIMVRMEMIDGWRTALPSGRAPEVPASA